MIWDKEAQKVGLLTPYDWRILGHELGERITLPCRRLDVPMPFKMGGFHSLAHSFAAISEELHRIPRLAANDRHAIHDVMGLLVQHRLTFQGLKREWEIEYRELIDAAQENKQSREHLKEIG